jgi:hypothetical protein
MEDPMSYLDDDNDFEIEITDDDDRPRTERELNAMDEDF